MSKIRSRLRNWGCALIALALMLFGKVRNGRKRAFRENVITALAFHNPDGTLFYNCLRWLRKNGYTFVSQDQVAAFLREGKPAPRGAVWITFDDGWRPLMETVLPAIREFGVPATVFIPSGIVAGDGLYPWLHDEAYPKLQAARKRGRAPLRQGAARESMTLSEFHQLRACPQITIGSHTVDHAPTIYCSEDELRYEIGEDQAALQAWTGRTVDCFAYPNGDVDGRESAVLAAFGFKLAVTTENAFVEALTHAYRVPRFLVADTITTPEAICNMVGVWRPSINRLKIIFGRLWGFRPADPAPVSTLEITR